MSKATVVKNDDAKSNFGKKGWLMIILAGIAFWFVTGATVDGLNVILAAIAEQSGMDYNVLLSWSTPAGWAAIPGAVVWAGLCSKKGVKFTMVSTLIVTAVVFAAYGFSTNLVGYIILAALLNFVGCGFSHVAANTLMANWFPRKKGLALGWATIGQNLSTAMFVPIVSVLIAAFGCGKGLSVISLAMIVFAFVVVALVKNLPEECGCTPDNDNLTREEIEANMADFNNYKSPFTVKKLLTMKESWMIAFAFGALYMVTVGLVSQLVPRLMSLGYSQTTAISYTTVAAIIGCFGSYFWGWLDQVITTKKASIVYGIWYIAALALQCLPFTKTTMVISIVMIGWGIGGIGNLAASIVAIKFGRYDFVKAWGVIFPMMSVVRCCAFSVLAFGLTYLGGYAGAYAIFIVANVIAVFLIWKLDDTCVGKPLSNTVHTDGEEKSSQAA
jgi:sugar phosphate permease